MSSLEALYLSDSPLPKVLVHPTAIFSILNSFSRRKDRDSRVIGTLLGEVKDGNVIVTDCFAVPFVEKVEDLSVGIDQKYHKTMLAFHRRNNKKEVVVGWYTTTTLQGQFINDNSSLIHDHYSSECENPINLVADTTLLSDNMNVRAFVRNQMVVGGEVLASCFEEVRVVLSATDAESTALYHMIHQQEQAWEESTTVSSLPTAGENVEHALVALQKVLDNAQTYVDAVVEGNAKVPVSREIGIALADTLNSFATTKGGDVGGTPSPAVAALNAKLLDLHLIAHVASLARAQSAISSRINQIL